MIFSDHTDLLFFYCIVNQFMRVMMNTYFKIYHKRDYFKLEVANLKFLDEDGPCCPYHGVYISQLICFARVKSNVIDFNNRN